MFGYIPYLSNAEEIVHKIKDSNPKLKSPEPKKPTCT